MSEFWVPCSNFPGYEASCYGRIRMFVRPGYRGTTIDYSREPFLSKISADKKGYLKCSVNGRWRYIHELVADAFLGPRPLGMDVHHLNHDKTDNQHHNLVYLRAALNTAQTARSKSLHMSRQQFWEIMSCEGKTGLELSEELGLSRYLVQRIRSLRKYVIDAR